MIRKSKQDTSVSFSAFSVSLCLWLGHHFSLLASVVEDVRHFSPYEQHDDITLIIAKCKEDQ
jgi:hypothetical protein